MKIREQWIRQQTMEAESIIQQGEGIRSFIKIYFNGIVFYLATEKELPLLELKEPLTLQLKEKDECSEELKDNTKGITVHTLKLMQEREK